MKLCTVCLKPNHKAWRCTAKKCVKCHKAHNSLLHIENYSWQPRNDKMEAPSSGGPSQQVGSTVAEGECGEGIASNVCTVDSRTADSVVIPAALTTAVPAARGREQTVTVAVSNGRLHSENISPVASQILLSTALVKIEVKGNNYIACALLDSGSQSSFITEALCNKLNLHKIRINHAVKGVGQETVKLKYKVELLVSSLYNTFKMNITCLINYLAFHSKKSTITLPENVNLADPDFNVTKDVDILLGSHEFWKVMCTGRKTLGEIYAILAK
ncbi:hypothetical protein NQ317_014816 [Molorchus minor]|uniref:Peptidase aspartic putative domain-containing protein n=1 Tax=Molorchus minor TaxID=1323400 RepID=A0ABQ9IW77_9CUCU|nr:hypothetical protein NQ317_014816 [Molorchus minor]